jgi:hypothetical protein
VSRRAAPQPGWLGRRRLHDDSAPTPAPAPAPGPGPGPAPQPPAPPDAPLFPPPAPPDAPLDGVEGVVMPTLQLPLIPMPVSTTGGGHSHFQEQKLCNVVVWCVALQSGAAAHGRRVPYAPRNAPRARMRRVPAARRSHAPGSWRAWSRRARTSHALPAGARPPVVFRSSARCRRRRRRACLACSRKTAASPRRWQAPSAPTSPRWRPR